MALKIAKTEEESNENPIKFMPKTFVFPEQQEEFSKFSKKHGGYFAAKPLRGGMSNMI